MPEDVNSEVSLRGFGVQCLGLRVQGLGFWVQGPGFRLLGLGFRELLPAANEALRPREMSSISRVRRLPDICSSSHLHNG